MEPLLSQHHGADTAAVHILFPAPEGWVRITQVVLSMSWLLPSLVITEVKSHSCIVVFNSGIIKEII